MPASITDLETVGQLESLIDRSFDGPVALLKHSNSCGISADILYQLGRIEGEIHVLTIQENRRLSATVAERLGHRHQSPQLFVLRDGKPVYHATHYAIDPDRIAEILNSG